MLGAPWLKRHRDRPQRSMGALREGMNIRLNFFIRGRFISMGSAFLSFKIKYLCSLQHVRQACQDAV